MKERSTQLREPDYDLPKVQAIEQSRAVEDCVGHTGRGQDKQRSSQYPHHPVSTEGWAT